MDIFFEIVTKDILEAKEKFIIVPCGPMPQKIGNGVDAAVFGTYKSVYEQWKAYCEENGNITFGDTFVAKEDGKVFILAVTPPYKREKESMMVCDLRKCYDNVLKRVAKLLAKDECFSIATPLLGAGGLHWPLGSAFYALFDTFENINYKETPCCSVVLYLKDRKAILHAKKSHGNLLGCIDESLLEENINKLERNHYIRDESHVLNQYYIELEFKRRLEKRISSFKTQEGIITDNTDVVKEDVEWLERRIKKRYEELTSKYGRKITNKIIADRLSYGTGQTSRHFANVLSGILKKENKKFTPKKDLIIALALELECSYDEVKKWLERFGFCINNFERDQIIAQAFYQNCRSTAQLNRMLELNNQTKLFEIDRDYQRYIFSEKVNEQINYIERQSGDMLEETEIAELSGLDYNTIVYICGHNKQFTPTKDKIIALACTLHCSLKQLEEWLEIFGLALSKPKREQEFDRDTLIYNAFKEREIYRTFQLNDYLEEYGFEALDTTNRPSNRDFNTSKTKDRERRRER